MRIELFMIADLGVLRVHEEESYSVVGIDGIRNDNYDVTSE